MCYGALALGRSAFRVQPFVEDGFGLEIVILDGFWIQSGIGSEDGYSPALYFDDRFEVEVHQKSYCKMLNGEFEV